MIDNKTKRRLIYHSEEDYISDSEYEDYESVTDFIYGKGVRNIREHQALKKKGANNQVPSSE